MNSTLLDMINQESPKISEKVTNGIAKQVLKLSCNYLDDIFKGSIKSLSPNVDFKYIGYRKLTPEEEYYNIILSEQNKGGYDIAKSDLYPIELVFEYENIPIKKYIYLPYADNANIITISNTNYFISPVLSDTVISPNDREVFVRLLKDKLIFKSMDYNFIVNKEKIHANIVYSYILKTNYKQLTDNIGKVYCGIALYLLAKYGFKETINRYLGIDLVTDNTTIILVTEDIEYNNYNIIESTKVKPRYLKNNNYQGHDLKIGIRKDIEITPLLENIIYTIIYTMDIFPRKVDEYLELYYESDIENELIFWRILIGRISYMDSYNQTRIYVDMKEHFNMLEGYLDNLIKNKLTEANIYVNNFFDLLSVILSNYGEWLLKSKEYNSNLSNRYIDILYYILYDIIIGFNKVILSINKRATKSKKIELKEINKILSIELSSKKIYSIVKSSQQNLCINLADTTTDLIYPKITAILEDQSRGIGVKKGSKTQFPFNTRTIKADDIFLGSMLYMSKAAPSPRFRANIFMDYDTYSGKINIDEDTKRKLDKLDKLLTGQVKEDDIEITEVDDIID